MTVFFFYVNLRIRNPSYATAFGMFLHFADKAGTTVNKIQVVRDFHTVFRRFDYCVQFDKFKIDQ